MSGSFRRALQEGYLLALAAAVALVAAPHPSLFFDTTEVAQLRAAAATTHKEIASHITTVLSAHLGDPAPTQADYGAGGQRVFGNDVAAWAFAYQLTNDPRYAAQAWLRLSTYLSWPDWGFGFETGQPDLFTAHMVLGVACAYDWLYPYLATLTWKDAAGNTAVQAVQKRLGTEAQKIATYYPDAWWLGEYIQNHNWIDTAALGLAGLVLQGEDSRAPNWISLAQSDLDNVDLAIGPISDGSWHEGLAYQQYGMAMALPFWMASRRAGFDRTDTGLLRGVGRMFLAATIPDAARQQILLHGDFTGWPREGMPQILRYAAARFHDGVAQTAANRWLAGGQRTGFIPDLFYDTFEFIGYDPSVPATDPHTLPLDTDLPDLQASVLHSTWDAGDLVLAFKAGPYGGRANFDRMKAGGMPAEHFPWGHDHNDDMSFWLYGGGTWLAPEAAGYDAGQRTGTGTVWANETQYHNGLLVDGNGELGDVRNSDSEWNNPWFYDRDATLLPSASTADYAVTGGRGANLYDASLGLTRWDRLLVLARKRYALVHDDIAATTAHTYDWLCHFPDGATPDGTGWILGAAKNGMTLGVRNVSPASWTMTNGFQTETHTDLFEPDGSIGFVKVRTGPNASPTPTQQFLAALVPVKTAAWASRMSIDALDGADTGAGAVIAPGTALEERWIFSRPAADGKVAGDLALASSLVGMAGYNAGEPTRGFLAGAGKISDQSGSRELLSSISARAIETDLQGTNLVVTGDGIADFRVYAPAATTVTLNGTTVEWGREGSIVVFPPLPPAADGGTPDPGNPTDPGLSGPGIGTGAPDAGTPSDVPGVQTSGLGPGDATHGGMGCSQAGPVLPGLLFLLAFAFARRRRSQRTDV